MTRGRLVWVTVLLTAAQIGASVQGWSGMSIVLFAASWWNWGYIFAPEVDGWVERRRVARREEALAELHADLDRQARESIRVRLLRDFDVDRPDAVGYQWSPFEGRLIVRRSVDGLIINETFEDIVERDGER